MNKFLTKIAKALLGLSMAIGVGIAVGSNSKAEPAKATDYVKIATFDFTGSATPTGTTSTALSSTTDIATYLNACTSDVTVTVSAKSGDIYKGKGSGGSGIPQAVFKVGKASGAGSFTFTISGSDNVAKVEFEAYGWKTTTALSVNSSATQSPSTAASSWKPSFVLGTPTTTLTVSSATSCTCIEKMTLWKEDSGTPTHTHTWSDWAQTVAPTCTTVGEEERHCTDPDCPDSATETREVAKIAHNYVAGTVHAATCTEDGYTEYECSMCGDSKHDDVVAATGHNYVNHVCTVCGAEEPSETTVTTNISQYATAHSWVSSSSSGQKSITMDENITASCNSGTNSGKYYSDGWRIYQNETGKITITASNNATLSSVTFTFTNNNGGTLNYDSSALTSGTPVTVSGNSAEFTLGNSGSATNGQIRITVISVTYSIESSSTKPRGTISITSPSDTTFVVGDIGNLTYSWTPNSEASSATITSAVWSSSAAAITVDNEHGTFEASQAGSATLQLDATDSTGEEYTVLTESITVTNPPFVLPDMPSGDYVKVTSAQDDYSGYYLIVYESGSVAFDGDLTTLDAVNNGVSVSIVDGNTIENNSTSRADTLNKSAVYISKNGTHYDIAANINKENVVFIGNDGTGNGLNTNADRIYNNTISFSTNMVVSGSGGKTIGYNNNSDQMRFRYFSTSGVSYYKKTVGVDTLRSIAIVDPVTSLKDGQKFNFGGSVTATYSQTGTAGHTGITSGLSFSIGGEAVTSDTTMTRGDYTVTVTYNDGTTSKSNTYSLSVGYADATGVNISGPSSISVAKGYEGTFTATVTPSNAENSVVWSVTDTSGNATSLGSIDSATGEFTAGNTPGTLRVVATSSDGYASSYVTVEISGDPLLEINKSSITAYSIDSAESLSVTPKNFPEGTITYSWASNNTNVATVSNVSTSTNSIEFVGAGGQALITVVAYVNSVEKASASCTVNVTKTRSVSEAAVLSGTYDFSSVTENGTRITDETVGDLNTNYYAADSLYPLDTPTLSLPSYDSTTNYVYLGNGTGGAHPSTGGMLKFGKSKFGGEISFTFTHTITKVVVSAQKWATNSEEGEIQINGEAPSVNAGQSSYVEVVAENLSTNTITISTPDSSARCFVNSITFYSQQSSTEIGRSADVVGLESFVENKLKWNSYHNDHISGDTTGDGSCVDFYDKDGESGAKYAFNHLNTHQKALFTTNSAYTNEWLRLQDWAKANGDVLDSETLLLKTTSGSALLKFFSNETTNSVAIIVIISMVSMTAIGGYFFLRKRKEN